MHEAIVCVASNTDAWDSVIEVFKTRTSNELDPEATFSPIYSTLSVTDGTTRYHNMVGRLSCDMTMDELGALMKQWEREAGRVPHSKVVPLDIDVVVFDGQVVRPRDFAQEYFKIGYKALDQGRSRRDI